jgi:hypothetical protein
MTTNHKEKRMSTKAIRELIEDAGKRDDTRRYELTQKALEEVEALEGMGAVLITCDITAPRDVTVEGFTPAMVTLGRLAKAAEKVAPESGQG